MDNNPKIISSDPVAKYTQAVNFMKIKDVVFPKGNSGKIHLSLCLKGKQPLRYQASNMKDHVLQMLAYFYHLWLLGQITTFRFFIHSKN